MRGIVARTVYVVADEPLPGAPSVGLSHAFAVRTAMATALVVLGVAVLLSLQLGLNGELQYVIGTIQAHARGGGTALDTFSSRPIAYRALLGTLAGWLGAWTSADSAHGALEVALRLVGVAAAAGAALVLDRGLSDRLGRIESLAVSGAVGLLLAVPPAWDFLQPEWLASVFTALAVGAALAPRRNLVAIGLAGICLFLVVAVKVSTVPFAGAALLTIWWFDRRRAVFAAVVAGGLGLAWLGWMVFAFPLEWSWLVDLSRLNANSPLRSGFHPRTLIAFVGAIGNKAALDPMIVVLPAAVLTLARLEPTWRRRAIVVASAALFSVLAVAPALEQGEWLLYHLTALPPLAGAVLALAIVRWWRASGRVSAVLIAPLPIIGLAMAGILSEPLPARHPVLVLTTLLAIGVLLAGAAALLPRRLTGWRRHSAGTAAVVGAGVLLSLAPVLAPGAAWAMDGISTPWGNAHWASTSAANDAAEIGLSRRIGRETPVLYLTWGDVPYHMGNPTDCRYPSPIWLQYGIRKPNSLPTRSSSYRDNLACLASPIPRFLVIEPAWFSLESAQAEIRSLIEQTYDCSGVAADRGILICPRRGG